MDDRDAQEFKEDIVGLCDYYHRSVLGAKALDIFFDGLSKFSLVQVKYAIGVHLKDPKAGQFFPKIGDIMRILEGGNLTVDQVIASARNKNTPLGIFCRIQIGHWDLEHQQDSFLLRQRAEECIQNLPEWKARALKGDYTEHEISIMLKYNVNPTMPFMNGLPPPENTDQLRLRITQVSASDRHIELLEESVTPSKEAFHPKITALLMQKMEKSE